jgi:hypothetical protein
VNAVLKPRELTRASVIGHIYRCRKTYGASVIGLKAILRFERAVGCRDQVLEKCLASALERGRRPFDPTGELPKVRSFTPTERAQREREARVFRASRMGRETILCGRQTGPTHRR